MNRIAKRKRMKALKLASAALALVLLASCASQAAYKKAKRELERGDLAAATLAAAKSLSSKPGNRDALVLLEAAFPAAVATLRLESDRALESQDPLRWETVARDWSTIHAMNDAIRALPPLYRKGSKEAVAFSYLYDAELLDRARGEAAEHRYREGLALMSRGSRAASREAYGSFAKALSYAPGYKDAAARAEEARDLGSDRIAILPFAAAKGDFRSASGAGLLYDGCVSALVALASRRDFLQVVDRGAIEAMLAERELSASELADPRTRLDPAGLHGANILVSGQLLALAPEYPTARLATEILRKEVDEPIPGAAPVNGVVPTRKAMKSATVTVFTKASALSVTAAYRAVDMESSVIIDARTATESMRDEYRWAVYSGDEEALSPEQERLVARKEAEVKTPEAMLPELCDRLARGFAASFAAKF
jgi:hypothetical protein